PRRDGPRSLAGAQLAMAVAGDDVVVHHPYRLHEGIDDRRTNEPESLFDQRLAHRLGLFRLGGDLAQRLPRVLFRHAVDELPQERAEAYAGVAQLELSPRISTAS